MGSELFCAHYNMEKMMAGTKWLKTCPDASDKTTEGLGILNCIRSSPVPIDHFLGE